MFTATHLLWQKNSLLVHKDFIFLHFGPFEGLYASVLSLCTLLCDHLFVYIYLLGLFEEEDLKLDLSEHQTDFHWLQGPCLCYRLSKKTPVIKWLNNREQFYERNVHVYIRKWCNFQFKSIHFLVFWVSFMILQVFNWKEQPRWEKGHHRCSIEHHFWIRIF